MRLLVLLALCLLAVGGGATASASECSKTLDTRVVAGGETIPTLRVSCDPTGSSPLRATRATSSCVSAVVLPPGFSAACELAAARAAASRSAAIIRRALRAGESPEDLADAMEASLAEILAIQDSMGAR